MKSLHIPSFGNLKSPFGPDERQRALSNIEAARHAKPFQGISLLDALAQAATPEQKSAAVLDTLQLLNTQFNNAVLARKTTPAQFDRFLGDVLLPPAVEAVVKRDLAHHAANEFGAVMSALVHIEMHADDPALQNKARELTRTLDGLHQFLQAGRQLIPATDGALQRRLACTQRQVAALVVRDQEEAEAGTLMACRALESMLPRLREFMASLAKNLRASKLNWDANAVRDLMQGDLNKGPQLTLQERALPDLNDQRYCHANLLQVGFQKPAGAPEPGTRAQRLYATFHIDGEDQHLVFDGRAPTRGELRGSELEKTFTTVKFNSLEDLMRQGSLRFELAYLRMPALGNMVMPLAELRRIAPAHVATIIPSLCSDPQLAPILEELGIGIAEITAELYSGRY